MQAPVLTSAAPVMEPLEVEIDKKDDIATREDIELGPTNLTPQNVIEFAHAGGATRTEKAARFDMEQNYLIPMAGDGRHFGPVGKWEKYMFMVFRE